MSGMSYNAKYSSGFRANFVHSSQFYLKTNLIIIIICGVFAELRNTSKMVR